MVKSLLEETKEREKQKEEQAKKKLQKEVDRLRALKAAIKGSNIVLVVHIQKEAENRGF
jgi:hypothetical protein